MFATLNPFDMVPRAFGGLSIGGITPPPIDKDPTIFWYDARKKERSMQFSTTFFTSDSVIPVSTIYNLADPSRYTTTSPSRIQSLNLASTGIAGIYAFRGGSNGYADTGYRPTSGAKYLVAKLKMAALGSAKSFFGCNDGQSRRFFLQQETNGSLTVGWGTLAYNPPETYAAGQELYVLIEFTGSAVNMWVNKTKTVNAQSATFTGTSNDAVLLMARTSSGAPTTYSNTGLIGEIFLVEGLLTDAKRLAIDAYMDSGWVSNRVYHVFANKGQSNEQAAVGGEADYVGTERPNFNIHQINRTADMYDQEITLAFEPLKNVGSQTGSVSLNFAFAKKYLERKGNPPDLHVLFVPCALGDTGYTAATINDVGRWVIGGDLHEGLISRTNYAMTTPNTQFIAVLETLGERDRQNNMTQSAFTTFSSTTIADIRARVTGAANSAYVVSGLVPEWGGLNNPTPVETAIADLPNKITKCGYIETSDIIGYTPDQLHFNKAGNAIRAVRRDQVLASLGF